MIKKENLSVFDNPRAVRLNQARKIFFDDLIPDLKTNLDLCTALDVGTGYGYFSNYLNELGFSVHSCDARSENIAEAKRRYPDIEFMIHNVEEPVVEPKATYDLVLCLGLLYHLENPFRAIRNLFQLTNKLLIVSTMIAPGRTPTAILSEEWESINQGLNYIALIPTETCFIKMLYKSGFPYAYKCITLPAHQDFRASLLVKRLRTVLIASHVKLHHPVLKLVSETTQKNRFFWYRFGLGHLQENDHLLNLLKPLKPYIDRFR